MPVTLNALNPVADINSVVEMVTNHGTNMISPEVFYDTQLLDTIRLDGDQYVYYRYADESPIQNKADKLIVRRWAPLQAHTVPIDEGVPPKSDKASVEKYEMQAFQYGRYMEFSDKVDFKAVDPIVAHYTREYSIVAMETLDLLARDELLSKAQKRFAGSKLDITEMNIADCKPTIADLRLVSLSLKKALVKPRSNGAYHVIVSPEFVFDMIDDPYVQQYMTLNQTTSPMYDRQTLVPLFGLEFYETLASIATGEFVDENGKLSIIAYKPYVAGDDDGQAWIGTRDDLDYVYRVFNEDDAEFGQASGYVKDSRTGFDASYIPDLVTWTLPTEAGSGLDWTELKIQHAMVLGKDALTRTGLTGEGNAKMYVKPLGSTGVLDPIDQRQSIGFKINSVGFGSTRLEAIVDYMCVPTQMNL
jgi:hypothetical protein